MNDLTRMKKHYIKRTTDQWSLFHCYPQHMNCSQTVLLTKILADTPLEKIDLLDIGAGEGNFILKLIILGLIPQNITAVEYLKPRFKKLQKKLPHIHSINQDFMCVELSKKYTLITLMAVLTSITDNTLRYNILEKALKSLDSGGTLILYDYFDEKEPFLTKDYRALSLSQVKIITQDYALEVHQNVYLKGRYAKGLCKIGLRNLIPFIQSLKIFNDSYHFVVIKK